MKEQVVEYPLIGENCINYQETNETGADSEE